MELDKFLKGEENHLKEHKYFVNYKYEFLDKSYPTPEMAQDLFHSASKVTKEWDLVSWLAISLFNKV